MQVIAISLGILIGYLLGSLNFAIIFTYAFVRKDIRSLGSGNAGLTNVLRSVGAVPAVLTLLGDFFKGYLAVLALRLLLMLLCGHPFEASYLDYLAAYGALLGHIFPVFYRFRGGKGILVSFGAMVVLCPFAAVVCLCGFLIVVGITRYVSLGSIVGAILFPTAVLVRALIWGGPLWVALLAVPMTVLVIYMHRSNIVRLIHHNENKLSFSGKSKK